MHLMMEKDMTEGISREGNKFSCSENIYRLAEELGIPERKVMDFSSPVNPLGVSKKIKAEIRRHLKYLDNHPDPEAGRLTGRLAQYHGVSHGSVVCGNGSSGILHEIVKALRPRNVLIPSPSAPWHEKTVLRSAMGRSEEPRIVRLKLREQDGFGIRPEEFIVAMEEHYTAPVSANSGPFAGAIALLCNPNYPAGSLLSRTDVLKIAESAENLGWHLVVDEAFIDFCPGRSVAEKTGDNPFLIVLRTYSYFHALAGLRVGYCVLHPGLSRVLKEVRDPLSVNSLAQRSAALAITDRVYRKNALKIVSQEKRFLEKSFKILGIDYFSSDANFYLLKNGNADEISRRLRKKGILIGDFSDVGGLGRGFLGIAVKSHKENAILVRELTGIIQK